MNRLAFTLACALGALGTLAAGTAPDTIGFSIAENRPGLVFQMGEEAVFTVTATNGAGEKVTAGLVKVEIGDYTPKAPVTRTVDLAKENPFEMRGTLKRPGFLLFKLTGDGVKKTLRGAGFSPERIRAGGTCPADFDAFWAESKAKLAREVPLDPKLTHVPERSTDKFDFWRMNFATFGGQRVWGFLTVPKDKSKAPFPVRFVISSAGQGRWTWDFESPRYQDEYINVGFTVHAFEPPTNQADADRLHEQLRKDLKAKYGVSSYPVGGLGKTREEGYFYRMILGVDRAADWIWERPDVDRSRFFYHGGSQGGELGIMLVGLNHKFTSMHLHVPAGMDKLGSLAGRQTGHPYLEGCFRGRPDLPTAIKNAAYYNGAFFASRVTCPVRFSLGFVDTTCPPDGVYAAYNELKVADKAVIHGLYRGHGWWPEAEPWEVWQYNLYRDVPENLTHLRPPKKASWQPGRTDGDHIGTDAFTLKLSPAAKSREVGLGSPAYCASGRIRLTFTYKSDVRASIVSSCRLMERPLEGKKSHYFELQIPPSKDWKDYSIQLTVPIADKWGGAIRIIASGEKGQFEAKDVRVVELPPDFTELKPVTVGGRRVKEISVLDCADFVRRREEFRTARMIRYMLYVNGYDYLPVRTVRKVEDIGPQAIVVGRAAEALGFFSDDDLAKCKGLTGAGVYRAKGTRLGISGAIPTGISYGAFVCLRDLGIEFLGGTQWRRPKGDALAVADGFGAARVPAIPLRCDNDGRMGGMYEMRGRCSLNKIFGNPSFGKKKGNHGPDHCMPFCFITTDEFADTHPEFFALQKDGRRQGKETGPWALQYCFSNPELQRITAERYLELMRADPGAVLYQMAPGDGGGADCKCENCRKLGSTSDVWVHFANAIAARTKKEFPDKYIAIYSYVDTPYAPKSGVKMDSNVCVTYCIYPTETWPSCMLWDTPMNKHGFESLEGWWKQCPRMGLVLYPMQCGDWMTLWPGYDFDVKAVREFASHRALMSRYFGLWPVHGESISQAGAFADLRINVLGRLEEDPTYDERAGTLAFIRDFYGAAEKPMLAYFDLIRAEPKRREWIQGCEQRLKGFVTKEFAAKCFPLLDAAEAAVKDDPARLVAVRHEKILFLWTYLSDVCRGRGNVSTAEFPAWAKRYGEFCRICRDTGVSYMGRVVTKWFNDTAFLDVKFGVDDYWPTHPAIQKIIDDPEKALGADYPNCQRVKVEKSAGGGEVRSIEIPARGMGGAIFDRASDWERKDHAEVRCVRRPTSGYGLVFTKLTLAEAPKGEVTLKARGIDNEKPSPAEMEILVNEKSIYKGKVPWGKKEWSYGSFTVPAGILHAGDNDIVVRNVTPDTEKDGACGDRFLATRNYFWGWFIIENLVFVGVK